jgi:pyridoxal phosphate enzyme (YggS family)
MQDEARLIAERIAAIQARIAAAAARVQRSPAEITLIAVTKTHPARRIAHVLAAGVLDLGENRVQEAEEKHGFFSAAATPPRWHLIGHLQRNKARRALSMFAMIHSVDDLRLAETLNRLVDEDSSIGQRRLPILLQVNVSGEATKEGFALIGGVASASWPAFVATVRQIVALPFIHVQGLMTIAPYSEDLEGVVRPCFRALREVRDSLVEQVPAGDWRHLSMGMSGDFEIAIEEGATLVRVGTAIFGER